MTTQSFLHDLAARGIILSADGDRLDVDAPDGALTDELLDTLRKRKAELLELLTSAHLCPGCAGEMRLQDRARDAWWCPACRRWADGQGRPLAKTKAAKPATREQEEARKLIADLHAAGCLFVLEDGELRLLYPSRMSAGLWARVERAGDVFLAMARDAAIRDEDSRDMEEQ